MVGEAKSATLSERAIEDAVRANADQWRQEPPQPTPAESPRTALVRALTAALTVATAAGDLHAARVAHEALGRLLAEPEPGAPTVTDLGEERAKRR